MSALFAIACATTFSSGSRRTWSLLLSCAEVIWKSYHCDIRGVFRKKQKSFNLFTFVFVKHTKTMLDKRYALHQYVILERQENT